jgi:hypothetical protein
MDTLVLNLNLYSGEKSIEFEGISFKNFGYIIIKINDINVFKNIFLDDGFLVFEELKKSHLNNGKYLIFTSVSGIADDSGWDYVNVENNENSIKWYLERDECQYKFEFDRSKYLNEIVKIENMIVNIDKTITIEPKYIVFPEQN